jgi:hypothetical protein
MLFRVFGNHILDFYYLMLSFGPDDNAIILNIIFGIKNKNT